jgi:acyl-CoA reductase-like NAD-dependent aldehyde dehydrogenase
VISEAAAQLESFNPATGERLGAVPVAAPRHVAAAVEQAAGVQRLWTTLRLPDRGRYMARAAQAVIDEFDELVDVIGAEQGRPRAEAEVMELLAAVETLQWLAEHGPSILGGERIRFSRTQHPVKRGRWTYEPLGVVGVLGPATEPFATPLGDAAVALMAGNGVVLKPSPHVPLCAERIARVFARAGLP